MQISEINSLITSLNHTPAKQTGSGNFTDLLGEALDNAQVAEESVRIENTGLLTGETDDLHTPLIEAQKAELALNLAIQIRNKVIDAYNQVMGMQL